MELVLEVSAPNGGASCAITQRVSRLYHKAADHTVECQAVVVTIAAVRNKVLHSLGTLNAKELYVDIAHCSVDNSHGSLALSASSCALASCHSLLILGWSLVKHISARTYEVILVALGRLPLREQVEAILRNNTSAI